MPKMNTNHPTPTQGVQDLPASSCHIPQPRSLLLPPSPAQGVCSGNTSAKHHDSSGTSQQCTEHPFFLTRDTDLGGKSHKASAQSICQPTQRHFGTPVPLHAQDARSQTDEYHRQSPCMWMLGFAPLITPPTGKKDKPKWSDCMKGGSL